jgi:YD repeat-containing protein
MSLHLGIGIRLGGQPGGASATVATTWNPADKSARITLTNGNLTQTIDASGVYSVVRSTISYTTGKRYFEATVVAVGGAVGGVGFGDASEVIADNTYLGGLGGHSTAYSTNGHVEYNGGSGVFSAYTTGDKVGAAIDLATKTVWFSKNGVWQNGDPSAGTGGQSCPSLNAAVFAGSYTQTSGSITGNFGATAFAYTPPSGFTAWNT